MLIYVNVSDFENVDLQVQVSSAAPIKTKENQAF